MTSNKERQLIWGVLLHMSFNMWDDRHARLGSVFDERLWRELLECMTASGLNMVVIDLGDAVKYRSHPEIAVTGAWTPKRLKAELKRIRGMGLEPIPKLNFSACHDLWLGPYSRCLSTETYYGVCRDLIAEVIDLFDRPRFFHLGMDEETAAHQRNKQYVVIRQFDLWWHDLKLLLAQVRKGGCRPWVWSDPIWANAGDFLRKMPRSVLQSNWYYSKSFSKKLTYVQAYLQLEAGGYDQVPTGSNWDCDENFDKTVSFCRRHISPKKLFGFLQTPWRSTTAEWHEYNLRSIELAGKARAKMLGRAAARRG